MSDLKYADILKANRALKEAVSNYPSFNINVISNVVTFQLNEILEYTLRNERINAVVSAGDYDNILQDSQKFQNSDTIVIFWEMANIIDGLQFRADTMSEEEVTNLLEKTKAEIDFVIRNLSNSANVIFNKFSSLVFEYGNLKESVFEKMRISLNEYLERNLPENFTLIDIDKIIAKLSVDKSIDLRYFYSSKSLYSIEFYKEYARFISPIIFALLGKAKKALIFDCDNTIWKGIVGEDGPEGIELSARDKNGNIFEEVQHLAKALGKQGIVIGLCSKNNPDDVEQVFLRRTDMSLSNEDLTIRKVNWADKVTNLSEIASELNIGIDSIVFVDDSPFEIDFIKENLPEVFSIRVPEKLYNYPSEIRSLFSLFYKKRNTKEDMDRVRLYKTDETRKSERSKFSSLEEYLASLELKVRIFIDSKNNIERSAQLTQKTNQFNFTGRRYTETEIRQFTELGDSRTYVFGVTDKFGDYGITGLAIVRLHGKEAEIDSFLMSCRIIGRKIENAVLNYILRDLEGSGIDIVTSKYIETTKNIQLRSVYDQFGFTLKSENNKVKEYFLDLKGYKYLEIEFITINVAS